MACDSGRTASHAKPIKFFNAVRRWYITPQRITSIFPILIGALVVEVFTEPWWWRWWWWFTTRSSGASPKHPIFDWRPVAMISQLAMQNQLKNLMLFAGDILYLRESPQFVRFLIGALVVEVFTEPWFATPPSSGASIFDRSVSHTDK